MGKASRDKGNRGERWLVKQLQASGFAAERVPLSGAARGRFGGDVSWPFLGVDRRVEVKCRATGFAQIREWLRGHWCVVAKCDRQEALVVIPLKEFVKVTRLAEEVRRSDVPFFPSADGE